MGETQLLRAEYSDRNAATQSFQSRDEIGELPVGIPRDVLAEETVIDRMRHAPVRYLASEESESALDMVPGSPVAVAVDPLDGSTNIDANAPVGLIFSILPALDTAALAADSRH